MHSLKPLVQCVCTSDSIYLMYKKYNLAKISYESNDAGETQWVIEPNWVEWEVAGRPDIPGITVEDGYRFERLYRDGMPYVVSCVCPSESRAMKGNRAELRQFGMYYYDPIEFLRRSRGVGSVCGEYYFSKSPTDYLDVSTVTRDWLLANYKIYCNVKE